MEQILITWLFSLTSWFLWAYLVYFFWIKTHKNLSILKYKEEKYQNLIIYLQWFEGVHQIEKWRKDLLWNTTLESKDFEYIDVHN